MRLLVITPDRERARDLFGSLEQMGVSVEYREAGRTDGSTAGDQTEPDAVLLHVEEEGALAGQVRSVRSLFTAPLLVCSGKPGDFQEQQCFQAGADDYQSTGCRTVILRLRLQRLIQIYGGHVRGMLSCRGLLEDREQRQFYQENVSLGLTGREYQVLHRLMHSREEVVPRSKLLRQIWGKETAQASRALDTVVKQLRRKLRETPVSIQTCYGVGYRCCCQKPLPESFPL